MKKQILVIDDDQLILYALAKILKDDGCEVNTATTTSSAINKLSHCPYDLCLLDAHLSELNGFGLIEIINDIYPKTKIILMAASRLDSPEFSEKNFNAITSGDCHFIPKPFNLCDITEAVQLVLNGEERHDTGCSDFENKSRKNPRKPLSTKMRFRVSIICQGMYSRLSVEAQIVDISDSGIGLLTKHPLRESQVISFDEEMENRTGVVAWSEMTDEENCRVGVKFA